MQGLVARRSTAFVRSLARIFLVSVLLSYAMQCSLIGHAMLQLIEVPLTDN